MSNLIGSVSLTDNHNSLYLGRVSIDGMNTTNKEILYMNGSDISGSNSFTFDYLNNRLYATDISSTNLSITKINNQNFINGTTLTTTNKEILYMNGTDISGSNTFLYDSTLNKMTVTNVSGTNLSISNINGNTYTSMIYNSNIINYNFNASINNIYLIDSTVSSIITTLPSTPVVGSVINFIDCSNTFISSPLSFSLNGNKFNGSTTNMIVFSTSSITYVNSSQGWVFLYGSGRQINYKIQSLVVGGGGSGGGNRGGGGGGGGVIYTSLTSLNCMTSYNITVGSGGIGFYNSTGQNGNDSKFTADIDGLTNIIAKGGGAGGSIATNGLAGGSGGGGGANASPNTFGGAGTVNQGSSGANGSNAGDGYRGCGGGGGRYGITPGSTINGVIGTVNPISGSTAGVLSSGSYYLSGGGGGGSATSDRPGPGQGVGGLGGGGGGGITYQNGFSGTTTSGGGGGGAGNANTYGGNGGSGVVVLSIPLINYSGNYTGTPIITSYSTNKILTFTSNGSYIA